MQGAKMKRLLLAAWALELLLGQAFAQQPNPLPPFVYPVTLGTSPAQVVGSNQARRRIQFLNPSATATVAVCPPFARTGTTTPTPIVCAVNGAGSITIPPYGLFTVDAGSAGSSGFSMGTAWNGVASAPSSPLTVLEFE